MGVLLERKPFEIEDVIIKPGTAKTVMIPVGVHPNNSSYELCVRVIHGLHPGKRLFVSATMHGDEVNGIEAIHRVMTSPLIKHIHGTLIVIPIVNMPGALIKSRYLPDRRDLNRCFPGSPNGSSASQLAHAFLHKIVKRCTHGIDLHTGSNDRTNLPQIRCDLSSEETLKLALAFGAPVILKSKLREGSLREESEKLDLPTIVYEGGEALRFNPMVTQAAVQGIFRVMAALKMIPEDKCSPSKQSSIISPASRWLRAPTTGIFYPKCKLGQKVEENDVLGVICDTMGTTCVKVVADFKGVVIGKALYPLVYQGDALFNIAWVPDPSRAQEEIEEFEDEAGRHMAYDDPSTF